MNDVELVTFDAEQVGAHDGRTKAQFLTPARVDPRFVAELFLSKQAGRRKDGAANGPDTSGA